MIDCEGRNHLAARMRDGDFQGAPPLAVALFFLENFQLSLQPLAPFELCFVNLDRFNTSKHLIESKYCVARFRVAKFELGQGLHLL
jgi:hypothetical protein